MQSTTSRQVYTGIGLAILATLIWSGNFVVARRYFNTIPPVALSFFRWLLASLILLPLAWRNIGKEWSVIRRTWPYLLFAALTGIALFNTFVYVGARYTTSINLALIGTTSSPIIAVILARIFLKEQLGRLKVLGILFCITGILYLLCNGDFTNLAVLHFGRGDLWVLAAGLSFAIYNTLVRKKPDDLSPVTFLMVLFTAGTVMLFPFYLNERSTAAAIHWDAGLIITIIYLSAGTSVTCFLIWNMAIVRLGAGRTALFGNLIPVFSIIEASVFLGEKLTSVHGISILLVFTGIILANIKGNQVSADGKPDFNNT